ncbi:hypothetical protein P2P36_20650, partial [Escherichia coli]
VPTESENYAASAAWKAVAPNILKHLTVNRRSPAPAGNTLTGRSVPSSPARPCLFLGKASIA